MKGGMPSAGMDTLDSPGANVSMRLAETSPAEQTR